MLARGIRKAGLLGLTVRIAAEAESLAEAGALHQLGVDIELGVLRQAQAKEGSGAGGVLELLMALQAVLTLVGRTKRRIALADERHLAMHVPIVGRDRPRVAGVDACRAFSARTKLAVQAKPQGLQLERRFVACVRWERGGDAVEPIVEVFEPRTPLRRDRELGAAAGHPAGAAGCDLVLIEQQAGTLQQTRLREGKSARAIHQPAIECVADASAHRADKVEVLGHCAAVGEAQCDLRVRIEIRKRDIAFNSQQHPRRQDNVVARLHTGEETAERIA